MLSGRIRSRYTPRVSPPSSTWIKKLAGRFIAFEGPDGSGKSTQLRKLIALCQQEGVGVCEVREPGGTPIGERVRQLLLDTKSEMTLRCEMLLYMASRTQLVEERIRPALARGEVVLADRFVESTYAYQGGGGGLPERDITDVARVALGETWPELVLLFDVDEETAARRTKGIGKPTKKKAVADEVSLFDDRIEARGREFHRKVRAAYLERAKAQPEHHVVIDARQTPEEIWEDLVRMLGERVGS